LSEETKKKLMISVNRES
jgi:hypothetical protein